jgi:hypothetical protein
MARLEVRQGLLIHIEAQSKRKRSHWLRASLCAGTLCPAEFCSKAKPLQNVRCHET